MEIRFSGHTAYRTEYHFVWIPKYRRRILNPGVKGYLERIIPKVMKGLPGYFVSTVGIDEEIIINYVKWQERQDLGQAKLAF